MRTIRLILTFYKSFALTGILVTAACLFTMYGFKEKGINVIQAYFWFKILTLIAIVFAINSYKEKEFYYYKNLGLSKANLWIPTLMFDFSLFLVSIISLAKYTYDTFSGS